MINKHSKTLTLVSLFLVASANAGVEKSIKLDDIPQEILQTAKESYPNFSYQRANTETETDGFVVYEIQGKDEQNNDIEVDINQHNEIEEVEIVFQKEMVPQVVLQAVEKAYPDFRIELIEATHSASLKVIGYEFQGINADKSLDLEVSADGKQITQADS